jgi:hypothetical protein
MLGVTGFDIFTLPLSGNKPWLPAYYEFGRIHGKNFANVLPGHVADEIQD